MAQEASSSENLSFETLENVAKEVAQHLKSITEFADKKIVIIGGLALWKYARSYRTTEDVDFMIALNTAPQTVKSKLLELPNSRFQKNADAFFFRDSNDKLIQIDFVPSWQSPYIPPTAVNVAQVNIAALPYASIQDLIVFKISSCGLRPTVDKKRRDARDAQHLLTTATVSEPLSLNPEQKDHVTAGLPDVFTVLQCSKDEQQWWKQMLGI